MGWSYGEVRKEVIKVEKLASLEGRQVDPFE